MKITDFDFELPDEAIARYPVEPRDTSRLMALSRDSGAVRHHRFSELPCVLREGDLLVVNESKVIPARLACRKPTGGAVEILLIEPVSDDRWRVMAKGAKGLRPDLVLSVEEDSARIRIVASEGEGFFIVEPSEAGLSIAGRCGSLPLPPYLGRGAEPEDARRYQTVYASDEQPGSVAAPTAGLHFTDEVFDGLRARGVETAKIVLHVGPGTFLPVRGDDIESHEMHSESFELSEDTVSAIERTRAAGGRVVAVGTTVVRTLESFRAALKPGRGRTDIFIRPGHEFRHVDAMITNFHLPRSTLLMLVSAFAGREAVLSAYRTAVSEGYRFFSFGDAMVIS